MKYIITASSADVELPVGISDFHARYLDLIDGVVADLSSEEVEEFRAKGLDVEEEGEYFIPEPMAPVMTSATSVYPTNELDPITPGPMEMMQKTGVERLLVDGVSGKGAHIGFVDTGVDESHPDIDGRMLNFRDFSGEGSSVPVDPNGHGTACVGFACGKGNIVAKFHGVAPDANYSMARVMDSNGRGRESNIILGLQWLDEIGCDIINVSLGSVMKRYSPLSAACDNLARKGRIVCIAAGNDGPDTLRAPANTYGAIVVAACNEKGNHSDFSSIGPAIGMEREEMEKPDVTAWGENCCLCRSAGTSMGTAIHDNYVAADGTSFATPFVAGLAALYKEVKGSLSNFQADIEMHCIENEGYSCKQEGMGVATIDFIRQESLENPLVAPLPDPFSAGCLMSGINFIARMFR